MPRVSSSTSAGWLRSIPAAARSRAPWADATQRDRLTATPFGQARECAGLAQVPWGITLARDAAAAIPWIAGQRLDGTPATVVWGLSAIADAGQQIDAKTSAAIPLRRATLVLWGLSARADIGGRIEGTGGLGAHPARGAISTAWGKQRPADTLGWVPWGMGRIVDAGTIVIVEPGDPDEPTPPTVPIRRTYIVINDVTLVRLPENTNLPNVYSISLSWDCDSWSVGWDASLPASALDAVMPESVGAPVELLATINGTSVHLLAENISRDRRFGDSRIKVSGRGRVAWLASPYADTVSRSNGSAMTAQQLAADALSINGVSIGWDLDWQIADWLVPTGAWSHQGAAIDAVKRIAESVGGYVVGHRNAQTLHVRPRYPSMPWSWGAAAPNIVLPADIARAESIAWTNKPAYNRAFVSGQQLGVLGIGTRSGTAGDLPAPLITDALITHLDAARARAGSLLADTGPQATINLELPVLPETGILDLGALIEYNDGATARRGLVRAVRVAVAYPQVWQNVEIETHA